jgi:hypothetical protein
LTERNGGVTVDAGATTSATVLLYTSGGWGAYEQVYGLAVGTVLSIGGQQTVQSGGVVS